MMRNLFLTGLVCLFGISASMNAQVRVGTDADPHPGAVLDLSTLPAGTKNGLLMPRVAFTENAYTTFQLTEPVSQEQMDKATGMMVYNTTANLFYNPGFYQWSGTQWYRVSLDQNCPIGVFDHEGNFYRTKLFGNQCWMTDNLRSALDKNGTAISSVKLNPGYYTGGAGQVNISWNETTSEVEYTPGSSASATATYTENAMVKDENHDTFSSRWGFLYEWTPAQTACPDGWRLPSRDDFTTLATFLGGTSSAGGKMKANNWEYISNDGITTSSWGSYAPADVNNSGFNALPAGSVDASGTTASFFGRSAFFWTSDTYNTNIAYFSYLNASGDQMAFNYYNKFYSYSIRCVKY